jgi:hypothetical protein
MQQRLTCNTPGSPLEGRTIQRLYQEQLGPIYRYIYTETSPGAKAAEVPRLASTFPAPPHRRRSGSCVARLGLLGRRAPTLGIPKERGRGCPALARWMVCSCAWAQARLPTFPVPLVPGTRGKQVYWIQIGGQKRGVEVALDGPMPQGHWCQRWETRLGNKLAAAVTELGEFGLTRGDFMQGAARTCNGASEHL